MNTNLESIGKQVFPRRGSGRARLDLVAKFGERFRRVYVDEYAVGIHLDLADQLGMLPDQVLGADIAGQLRHFGEKAPGPQYRVAALAATGRDDDRAAFQRVETGDQPVDIAPGDQRHVAEADDDAVDIVRQRGEPAFQRCGQSFGEGRVVHALDRQFAERTVDRIGLVA